MLPFFQWQEINLGFVQIQVWGLMVALSLLTVLLLAYYQAKKKKLSAAVVLDLGFWVVLSAMLGGRFFYLVEDAAHYLNNPIEIFKIWEGGMSISGGFLGAVLAAWIILKVKRLNFWDYAELIVFYMPLGLFIGRLGCFFIFDHPGIETSFFLGQEYLDGIVRHNHGLYLSLHGLLLFLVFLVINYKKKFNYAFYCAFFLIEYGVLRIVLDHYRLVDSRWFGLSAAQFFGIFMVILGLILLIKRPKRG